MRKTLLILSAVLVVAACGNRKNSNDQAELKIEPPKVPTMITDPNEAMQYMADHYWDNMDFADTAYINKDVTEQFYADYLNMLRMIPTEAGVKSIQALMDKAKANEDMYDYFIDRAEHYLYDPNSPYRDEDLYISVLENIVSRDDLEDIYKLRYESQLEMALKNRIGQQATDIAITLSSGRTLRLHDIKADFTLLFFINPDCGACALATEELNESPVVRQLIESGELKVVTVYPDEDLTAWRNHLADMPGDWINSYDGAQVIRNQDLYDLRAIPSLYLLDRDKAIILKDIPSGSMIHNYLMQMLYR